MVSKKLWVHCAGFALILVLSGSRYASAQHEDHSGGSPYHRNMNAVRMADAPKIDGILDDPVWQKVEFQSDFLQREPNEGEPATEITEFALIFDENNLYIGVRCYDSEPDRIVATEMRRDERLWNDDYFTITFDTYHDRRNAFYFTTNPNGMRRDGTISDEGRIDNSDWNGIWNCKTSVDDRGWFVEMIIPWQTLRFKEGNDLVWGANFMRRIQRKNEDDYWRLVPRYAGRFGYFRMSEAGDIFGFDNLKMGGKYEFRPFVTGGMQDDEQTGNVQETLKDAGMDFKWNVTSTMTADFTYNTDFAQVEADQEQVNLTRFSLYFPEKRGFFLEGAETFRFGQTGRFQPWRPQADNIQLFYSRRIGIEERSKIPLLGGARLNGRVGKYTVGLLSINSERQQIEVDDEPEMVPETNYSVFRLKRDLFTRSSVGVIFLNKQQNGGFYNRSLGFDSNFPVNENLSFYAAAAGTYSPDAAGEPSRKKNNFAGNAGFAWQSDLWEYGASFLDIEEQFNPEMGFILREDIKRTEVNLRYKPRPSAWESVRQIEMGITGQYQTDHRNFVLNRKMEGEFEFNLESTARISFDIVQEYEYLDEDWEVRDGYVIPVDGYNNSEYRLRYGGNSARPVSGSVNASGGNYFTGTKKGGGLELDIKLFNRFISNLIFNYDQIELPQGNFHTTTIANRISYSFSPDVFVKAFLQMYDDKLENDGKNRLSGNIIFRYIYKPGNDFFLVLNQENLVGPGHDIIQNRTILAKINYLLRK
ncbi:DUF5916 domain-containing protein [candidate division KSB1 bacterium]